MKQFNVSPYYFVVIDTKTNWYYREDWDKVPRCLCCLGMAKVFPNDFEAMKVTKKFPQFNEVRKIKLVDYGPIKED